MRQRNTCAFLNNATNICMSLVDVILSGSSTSSTAPKSKLWQLGNSSTSAWTYPRNFRIFTLALLHFLYIYIYIYIYNCTIRQTFMRPQTFCLPPGFGCHPSAIPDIPVTSPCRSVSVRVGPCLGPMHLVLQRRSHSALTCDQLRLRGAATQKPQTGRSGPGSMRQVDDSSLEVWKHL